MDYGTLKAIHQTAVVLSVTGFFARGLGALTDEGWIRSRVARTLPHAVDSVLLASALALAWQFQLDPEAAPWLLAKIVGLIAYIALGMLALRAGRPKAVRGAAWFGALLVFGYIVSVAITKSPLGALGLL